MASKIRNTFERTPTGAAAALFIRRIRIEEGRAENIEIMFQIMRQISYPTPQST
jgi:hypothetical protein